MRKNQANGAPLNCIFYEILTYKTNQPLYKRKDSKLQSILWIFPSDYCPKVVNNKLIANEKISKNNGVGLATSDIIDNIKQKFTSVFAIYEPVYVL